MKSRLSILSVCLLVALQLFSQDTAMQNLHEQIEESHKSIQEQIKETEKLNASIDSSMAAYNQTMMDAQRRRDSANMAQNMNYFLADQKARKDKEFKNWMITRGIFALGLILAFIGVSRRKKLAKARQQQEEANKNKPL